MKRLLLIAAVIIAGLTQEAFSYVDAGNYCSWERDSSQIQGGSDGRPWPFGLEQPFPWNGIQGVWGVEMDGAYKYFVFRVIRNGNSERFVRVDEYDGNTCTLLSIGNGVEMDRVLNAGMISCEGRYLMQVRAFRESDVNKMRTRASSRQASDKVMMVVSVSPWSQPAARATYPLVKISSEADFICQ